MLLGPTSGEPADEMAGLLVGSTAASKAVLWAAQMAVCLADPSAVSLADQLAVSLVHD